MPYSYRSNGRPLAGRRTRSFSHSSRRHSTKDTIHPDRFIKRAHLTPLQPYVPLHTFEDFVMHELLRENIRARQFTLPSPIQDQAIPEGLAGRDVVGVANTGTGKTIAF